MAYYIGLGCKKNEDNAVSLFKKHPLQLNRSDMTKAYNEAVKTLGKEYPQLYELSLANVKKIVEVCSRTRTHNLSKAVLDSLV